ncbi:alpha/beta fold hydrolase [Spirosoma areae]
MKLRHFFAILALISTLTACTDNGSEMTPQTQAQQDALLPAAQPPAGFTSRTATVNGVRLHYVIGGQGEPLVLLHGWPETWYEWHRVMPALAQRYTVIVPDLRGIGESDKTLLPNGFDKKTLAADLRGLVQQLGYPRISLVGHDIGMMVAYTYAAQYPGEVRKLVLMDAPLPGIEPFWTGLLQDARSWHFGFYAADGDAAVHTIGSTIRPYLVEFIQKFAANKNAFTTGEINEIARAYSQLGALRSSFDWYKAVYSLDIAQNKLYAQQKLTMPVLALGGEFSGPYVLPMVQSLATNVRGGTIANSGHWIVQEQPQAFLDQLLPFLAE